MSYETANYLPAGISKRKAINFAELLGYRRNGTYAHLGQPEAVSLIYFEEQDYRSWETVELRIFERDGAVVVATRTRIGRSHYDFAMQNRTVREFRERFGGRAYKDDGNGAGYDPGPPLSPPASGCKLAMDRLDWNLSRINHYLMRFELPAPHESQLGPERIWPQMRAMNPEVFAANALVPYITSMMEDFFKSTYIALLRYTPNKAAVLKGARLRGDQLSRISDGTLTVEEAFAEMMPFHLPSNVGQHFRVLENKLDILAPIRKTTKRNKISQLDKLDALVGKRHALIHGMQLDLDLDKDAIERLLFEVTDALARVYKQITTHYGWVYDLPISSNFGSRRAWQRRQKSTGLSISTPSQSGTEMGAQSVSTAADPLVD